MLSTGVDQVGHWVIAISYSFSRKQSFKLLSNLGSPYTQCHTGFGYISGAAHTMNDVMGVHHWSPKLHSSRDVILVDRIRQSSKINSSLKPRN